MMAKLALRLSVGSSAPRLLFFRAAIDILIAQPPRQSLAS
jgi:hypothetical protein